MPRGLCRQVSSEGHHKSKITWKQRVNRLSTSQCSCRRLSFKEMVPSVVCMEHINMNSEGSKAGDRGAFCQQRHLALLQFLLPYLISTCRPSENTLLHISTNCGEQQYWINYAANNRVIHYIRAHLSRKNQTMSFIMKPSIVTNSHLQKTRSRSRQCKIWTGWERQCKLRAGLRLPQHAGAENWPSQDSGVPSGCNHII